MTSRINRVGLLLAMVWLLQACIWTAAAEPDWASLPYTRHADLQSVTSSGAPAYTGGFPIRLRGVLLNNPGDLLDASPHFLPYSPANLWNLGGQWQVFVQSVDPGDSGGTAAWMGQNYGNIKFIGDTDASYTDAEWLAEIGRLNHDPTSGLAFSAGDLVEIRARTGLHYKGKFNVNEAHNKSPANDFEIHLLTRNYGLPQPAFITLAQLKDQADQDIFDSTRMSGGEAYQATLVTIQKVQLVSTTGWARLGQLELVDQAGHTLPLVLGSDSAFDLASPPVDWFNVTGILDQEAQDGRSGYRLWVTSPDAFTIIPEPGSMLLLALAALSVARRRWRCACSKR